jgi:hypothetical protein
MKQDHVIKKEEFEERIQTCLMFKASLSNEDGPTSFWTFLVVTLLALTWARGGGQRLGELISIWKPILKNHADCPL